jgi:hypothetical protein
MKRLVLITLSLLATWCVQAQVIFYVESPEEIEGDYEMTWSDPANGWGSPDLNFPENSVLDTLVMAYDGSAADSLCCDTAGGLVNALDVFGKIAVLYRGSCQFGVKATNAQNAGAVAVVVINNAPGAPIVPAAGDVGANVTIPLIIITQDAGALLVEAINSGTVTGFIGSKNGYYPNDIGMWPKDLLVAPSTLVPSLVSTNETEFAVPLGSWVYNFGYNDQTAVRMQVTVNSEAGVVYTESSESVDLIAGDSIYFAMPDFAASSYAGYYDISYALFSDSLDSFVSDNARNASFKMSDEYLSYGALDSTTQLPVPDAFYRPSDNTGDFMSCIYFRNPNASRLFAEGIEFAATTATTDSLTNLYFESVLYEWNDDFTDLNDPNLAFDNLNAIAYGEYYYDSNLQNELVYSPFDPGTELEDDVRYLFCVSTAATNVYIGFSTEHDYDERLNYTLEPVGPINDNGTWYSAGFGTDVVPCLLAKLTDVSLGVNAQNTSSSELTAFPNPSSTFIQIPLGKEDWNSLEMYDQKGVLVSSRSLDSVKNNVRVDVTTLQNGLYTLRLMNNAEQRNFKVLVSK